MTEMSPFLDPGPRTAPNKLALVHLSRDNIQPVLLQQDVGAVNGYAEGSVINTRFGSFPHSTLLNIPWGSQVRASVVDTGSRGRKKRRDFAEGDNNNTKSVVQAPSGFLHILPPTPELWTTSLPHRTQVVYTPDYSYILHRIRARPGKRVIEAGAGSGSFTHAAMRAVWGKQNLDSDESRGNVFSYEFNRERYQEMQEEVKRHGLESTVQVIYRDVYKDGFLVDGESPEAECVFLDLPAPWKALRHLSRRKPNAVRNGTEGAANSEASWKSPLRSDRTVHLCTFSPCIEQVMQTVEVMRRLGWMEIEMVEVAHKKITVLREKVGLNLPNERGMNQTPFDVAEALDRLKEVEGKCRDHQGRAPGKVKTIEDETVGDDEVAVRTEHCIGVVASGPEIGAAETAGDASSPSKTWATGRLVHRTEPDLKTHTSYLVFAVLPQEWSGEQEAVALEKWPCGQEKMLIGSLDKAARKQQKRDLMNSRRKKGRDAGSPEDGLPIHRLQSGSSIASKRSPDLLDRVDETVWKRVKTQP